jgi:hypothetical protein
MSHESITTTDHAKIKRWCEDRNGIPAQVDATGGVDDPGILRIEFIGDKGDNENLSALAWPVFFEKFDEARLAFLFQEETATGDKSRFCKFVNRN